MDIIDTAREEISIFERPSKATCDALIAEVERLRIEVDVQSYWGPKWEVEHAEVTRLRKILQDNGIAV